MGIDVVAQQELEALDERREIAIWCRRKRRIWHDWL
jgi:hypothetical protein